MTPADLTNIVQRLDRIEQALSLQTLGDFINPGDPPPIDTVRLRSDILNMRLIDVLRQMRPNVDPPPVDAVRARQNAVYQRLAHILQEKPADIAAPSANDILNVRILDLLRRYGGGYTDPAPDDFANIRLGDLLGHIPDVIGDPSPEDIARLNQTELQAQLHKINTEIVRLQSLERTLKERISATKQPLQAGE